MLSRGRLLCEDEMEDCRRLERGEGNSEVSSGRTTAEAMGLEGIGSVIAWKLKEGNV